ncbi:MAG: Phosphate ABC transporter, permease protein PstA (TC 3.A.1.7.1) [Olavius algarvensis Gamma 1 endosymbiont]|nr:MAG: Phosphate ABC transporter, permease protein PstA (TC 3.A.1.7.1) [Olavius algarvensis Gamma 1 endosymbiont]
MSPGVGAGWDSVRSGGSRFGDHLFVVAVWVSVAMAATAFIWIIGDLLVQGGNKVSWGLLVSSVTDSGRSGGIAPILVSTTWIVAAALAVAFPLALATAILIAEFLPRNSMVSRLVVASLDLLAGMPSIVFGLFGNALFNQLLGFGYSLLSGGLTLACMVLPFMIKANVDGLRAEPNSYREAADALALSRSAALWHVLLPTALPGIVAGTLLGLARACRDCRVAFHQRLREPHAAITDGFRPNGIDPHLRPGHERCRGRRHGLCLRAGPGRIVDHHQLDRGIPRWLVATLVVAFLTPPLDR